MEIKVGLVLAIVVALGFGVALVAPEAYSATEIYVVPPINAFYTVTTSVGFKFNVTVLVRDVSDLFAYQVTVHYDSTMLNASRAWLPRWDTEWVFYNKATVGLSPVFRLGNVQLGDSLLGDNTFNGSGKLAIVEFEIVRSPAKMEILSCALATSDIDTYLLDYNVSEIPTLKTDGLYSYTWSPPSTKPHLAVNPALLKEPNIGSAFFVQLYIMGIDAAWELTNATISLTFNSTIIDVIGGEANVTVSENWLGPNLVNVLHGVPDKVDIIVRNPVVSAGDLLIARVTFTVMSHGISALNFSTYHLSDHVIEIPTDPPLDGLVNTEELITDIAVIDVESSKTVVGKGYSAYIDVTLMNEGDAPATFQVTVYANALTVRTQTVSLSNGSTATVSFRWDTAAFSKGEYAISAEVAPLLGEIDVADNSLTDGTLTVAIIGDITGSTPNTPDGKVDIRDIATVAKAFGSYPGHQSWNPNADVTGAFVGVPDDKVDIKDIASVAKQFGKIDP